MAADITRTSGNQTPRSLADSDVTQAIGNFAGRAAELNTAHDVLTQGSLTAVTAAVMSALTTLGDAFSLVNAVNDQDVESGVIALISLTGTRVATVFAPAGVVIVTGLVVCTAAKKIRGWFRAKDRDWRLEPPGDPRELIAKGAHIRRESHIGTRRTGRDLDGRPLTAQEPYAFAPTRITRDDPQGDVHRRARAKPLLNSRWSEAAKNPRPDTTPVTYTVTAVTLTGIQRYRDKVVFTSSQDGRGRGATCRVITGPDAGGESVRCELEGDDRIVVSEGRPALIAIDFNHLLHGSDPKDDGAWFCDETAGPCVPQNSQNPRKYGSVISVESPDDKQRYDVPVQLGYGTVRGLPADKVERLE
ncbi:hypothetical protein [Streptomyces sp. S1]|uniref:hypothetical protein n=1 Tax=Streptomyces sp. S1 TaxID=718288 RepID=UPI000EF7EACB|nr:hypothetical protein [Streptomyces sp. S1]